jgi:PTS system fructose-specific IIC component
MGFFDILDTECIDPDLKSKDKYEAIEDLLNLLEKKGYLKNKEVAKQDVVEREQYLSTGLENGLAIPHAKTEGVEELVLSFGISREGIDFETLDGKPAHFIFCMLSPRDTSGPHLKALGQITRTFRIQGIQEALMQAKTPEEIKQVLNNFNERGNSQG